MTHRLQILLDEERYVRLSDTARREGRSVAAVVRDALDRRLGAPDVRKRAALELILSADPMPVPGVDDLHDELEDLRGRRG